MTNSIPNVRSLQYSRTNQNIVVHAGGNHDYAWPLCRNHVKSKSAGYWLDDARDVTCKNCLKLAEARS